MFVNKEHYRKMDDSEKKAIEELREGGYVVYDDGILYTVTKTEKDAFSQIEIVPWKEIRRIFYLPPRGGNNSRLDIYLWSPAGQFTIALKPGAYLENVYKYLASKFASALTKPTL